MKTTFLLILVVLCYSTSFSQSTIKGITKDKKTNTPLEGVRISITNSNKGTFSKKNGEFSIPNLKPGTYKLVVSYLGYKKREVSDVIVSEGLNLNLTIDLEEMESRLTEDVIVYGASKRAELAKNTPAAVTALSQVEIQKAARSNQVGNALEGQLGVDVTRNGNADFQVNTRGFNNSTNRRLLVLVDGRDVALQQIGAPEWNSLTFPMEDFQNIELIRGPSAALFGPNAFNGVLNLRTYAPKDVVGTKVSLLGGDYNTYRADVRHAGIIDDFSYRVNVGTMGSRNLNRDRKATSTDPTQRALDSARIVNDGYSWLWPNGIEQNGITDDQRNSFSYYGSARLDYQINSTSHLESEFGYTQFGNEFMMAGAGRIHVPETSKKFGRLKYVSEKFQAFATYNDRNTLDTMRILAAPPGTIILDHAFDINIDLQYNETLADNLFLTAGLQGQYMFIDSRGTVFRPDSIDANFAGAYAQLDYKPSEQFRIIGSARVDRASIHPTQFSPRVSVVYTPNSEHSFRLTGGRAFQRPNFSELFRRYGFRPALGAMGPINFRPVQDQVNLFLTNQTGTTQEVNLGLFTNTQGLGGIQPQSLGLGNTNLTVESNNSYELGYRGIITNNLSVNIEGYYARLSNFISGFLPGANEQYKSWSSASKLSPELAQYATQVDSIVYSALPTNFDKSRLSTVDGNPAFVISNANIGLIENFGIDAGVSYFPMRNLELQANYSYFGFNLLDAKTSNPFLQSGFELISANTSPHRVNLSATYQEPGLFDITVQFRYVDSFVWLAGDFRGEVPAYALVNLNGGYQISNQLKAGFSIYNLLDRKHYQILGGTLIPRLANASLSYTF